MSFLVARIDYALTRGINWLTTCLVERARGFSSSEAGDFLAAPGPSIHGYRLSPEAQARWGEPSRCPNAGRMCNCTGACLRPHTPAASAGRGESSSRAVSDVPPSPARERGCSCVEAPHNYCARHGATLGAHPMPTDPSPTIASRQHQPSVDGEGSPLDSAILPAPRGEHPTPGEFAAVAVREVLAEHTPARIDSGIGCGAIDPPWPFGHFQVFDDWHDWREHVSTEIQRRIDAATTNAAPR